MRHRQEMVEGVGVGGGKGGGVGGGGVGGAGWQQERNHSTLDATAKMHKRRRCKNCSFL